MLETRKYCLLTIILVVTDVQYLKQKLNNIFEQTFLDYSLVIIAKREVHKKIKSELALFKFKKVRLVVAQENTASVRKTGRKLLLGCISRYACIIEVEDLNDTGYLEKLILLLEENAHVGVAYCASQAIDMRGRELSAIKPNAELTDKNRWKKEFVVNGKSEVERYLLFINSIPHLGAAVFRVAAYQDSMDFYSDSLTIYNDWARWIALLLISDLAYTPEVLHFYRFNNLRNHLWLDQKVELVEYGDILRLFLPKIPLSQNTLEKIFHIAIAKLKQCRSLTGYVKFIWKVSLANQYLGKRFRFKIIKYIGLILKSKVKRFFRPLWIISAPLWLPPKQMAAIVIPLHGVSLSEREKTSLRRCLEVFGHKYQISFVVNELMDVTEYTKFCHGYNVKIFRFRASYFTNLYSYSRLLMSRRFYREFLTYQYILIYQLDSFVFKDNLLEWCNKKYDYIGAPWLHDLAWIENCSRTQTIIRAGLWKLGIRRKQTVGNGGFSLRRVKTFYYWTILFFPLVNIFQKKYNFSEDVFWSFVPTSLPGLFKIPSESEALQFAFETVPQRCFELNDSKLPFGCHAWEKWDLDFWRPHFKNEGYVI